MDLRKLKKLIDLLEESNLAEIEIKEGEESVRLARTPKGGYAAPAAPVKETIDYDTFAKADLRAAKVLNAELVEGADKLLRLTLDIGEAKPRNVFAGIRKAYDPAKLIGRTVVMVANLAPRKMRFGVSEGMILAAGNPDGSLYVVTPDSGALPGAIVK